MSISRGIYNELIYRIGENMGITCILILIIIVLIAVIIGYKREFRRISKQINNNLDEYANIKTKSVDKDIEYLVENINLIFDSKQRIVAEKNKNEEELRASIANMSHDLRTPLTSIMGYLQMIRLEGISEEEKNEYIDIVENRAKSLQHLISSFFDFGYSGIGSCGVLYQDRAAGACVHCGASGRISCDMAGRSSPADTVY